MCGTCTKQIDVTCEDDNRSNGICITTMHVVCNYLNPMAYHHYAFFEHDSSQSLSIVVQITTLVSNFVSFVHIPLAFIDITIFNIVELIEIVKLAL